LTNTVRLFLKDNKAQPTKEQREQLQQLHGLLITLLLDSLKSSEPPSTALLETARRFLIDSNVTKDVTTATAVREGLEQLSDLSLPFVIKH
jgi:hypothetical protein